MNLKDRLFNINKLKFSFGKADEYFPFFCSDIDACSMFKDGFGLGISSNLSMENQLRGVFTTVSRENGIFIFNISGVNISMAKNGFESFDIAESNNSITEWELSIILTNRDYLENTIFHNGKVELIKNDDGLLILWN